MFAIILCCFFVTLLKDGKLLCLESFQIAFIFKMKRFFFVYACLCESKERGENEKKKENGRNYFVQRIRSQQNNKKKCYNKESSICFDEIYIPKGFCLSCKFFFLSVTVEILPLREIYLK